MTTLHSRTGFLRSKVFLALAGVFLVFVAGRAALLWWEYDRTLAAEQRRAENLAHVLAEHLDRTFGALESAVNQLAVRSDRIGGPRAPREEWSAVLSATLSGLSGIGSLNLLDAEGFVVLSTNPAVTGTSRRGRYLHRRLKDERSSRLVIGPAAPAEHIGGARIPIGRALHDAEGNFVGFVAATFQPERLRSFYEAIDVGPHGVIRLFHADGNLLFSQPHAVHARQEAAGNAAIPSASRNGAGRGFLRAPFGTGSDSYLTAWRALSGSALVVMVSVAERDAFSAWYTELVTVSGSAGGMALLLGLAGAWITTSGRVHAETAAERDRAGAALQRSQVQFQAIIDHSPSGIVLRDRDGRHLVANRKVQEWYGLPAEEILGKTVSELFGEEAGREAAEQDRRVAATGDVLTREVETTFPDGAVRRIATTEFPVRFADDDTVFLGGILTDVTSAREAEEKLRQSQKMEAIGQLTGGVAHDFNNMLTAIMGNLEFLRDLVGRDEAALGYLDTALRAAVRSSELTHRLLAFSRRQPMAPVSTDVNRLVADCRVLLQRTLGAEIGIETYMSANAWPALVDPSQLENALLNLAINARDAMPGGGKLTIESANMTFDDNHAARNPEVAPGPHVMISVSDTGTGIARDALRHVFEPFYTTKPQGEGTGLGLSMVYGFAKQSGGHVSIYSELGHGTTVRLFLPRAAGAGPGADAPEAAPGEILTGTETILVVEDDEDVAEFVGAALESLGYTVVPAPDGPSALRCLGERGRVDLLLTDVVLPNGMNGREIAAQAREIVPDIRTVFMSGYAESIIVHQGRLEEGLDFLPKPFARDALARKVRASLDSRPARPAT